MNYGVRPRFQLIQMIPNCNVAVNADFSHCCSSLSVYPSVFLCPTESIFSRHTSLVLSLCITQRQHYGAINTHRQNENRWCCGWVVAEYEWAWVQRTEEIREVLPGNDNTTTTCSKSHYIRLFKNFPLWGKVQKYDCMLHTRVGVVLGK